jgi:hypothetical protein
MHRPPPLSRASFRLKAALAIALVALADFLFVWRLPGVSLGLFALAGIAAAALTRPALLKERRGGLALAAAAAFALILVDRPGPLAWLLFGLSLTVAVLSARTPSGETVWGWMQRLVVQGVIGLVGPLLDLIRLSRLRRRRKGLPVWALVARLLMPVIGGAVFLALFASANPLISDFLARMALPPLPEDIIPRIVFWGFVLVAVWSVMRPRGLRKTIALPTRKLAQPSAAITTSVTWSLIVFNAVFALQNGLDLAFLWSGAPLPGDTTLADYAHRGAYPLIATALLAGLFVLIALQPGSDTARRPLVRRLVVLWIAQNMLLVASSLLRTADYIEAYALTRFRIAAMVWMVLVGLGLLLICWRMLRDKSAHWLINANVLAALGVLSVISAVDLGAVAAAWNVRHAREVGGRGVELDLGYLRELGDPALVSLVRLEQSTNDPRLIDRVAAVRTVIMADMTARQSEWRSWTWRNQRRLNTVQAMTRSRPLAVPRAGERDWDGRLTPPPAPRPSAPPEPGIVSTPEQVTSPLTSTAGG